MSTVEAVVRRTTSAELSPVESGQIRAILRAAFADDGEGFTDEDWAHALGGVHVVLTIAGRIVAHASVVEREIHIDDRPLRAGYVEAVATLPERQGAGLGTRAMREVNAVIRERFELGALSTGTPGFYARLGWLPWTGPTAVRTTGGMVRTPDDDGGIMVLETLRTPPLDRGATLSWAWRRGDVW